MGYCLGPSLPAPRENVAIDFCSLGYYTKMYEIL